MFYILGWLNFNQKGVNLKKNPNTNVYNIKMFILQYTDIELLTSKTLHVRTSQIFAICSSFNNETSHYNFGHCTVEVGGGNCDERMLMSLV